MIAPTGREEISQFIAASAPSMLRGDDAIWRVKDVDPVSYPDDFHDSYNDVEGSSFWFNHRNDCINLLIDRFPYNGAMIDVGGGNGYVALGIMSRGRNVMVVEPDAAGVRNANRRGLEVAHETLGGAKFKTASVPAVGMFDVLEHIEDDRAALKEVHRILAPDGVFYLTVPAHAALWSTTDVAVGHYRRYNHRSIQRVLESAGFNPIFNSYFFGFLVPPIFLLRSLPSFIGLRRPEDAGEAIEGAHALPGGPVGHIIRATLNREKALLAQGRTLSFGSSLLVAARKAG